MKSYLELESALPPKPKVNYSLIKILTGSDLAQRRLPFMSISSPVPGPVIWLTACMHGDEVGGLVIIQEIFKLMRRFLRKGTIHSFPLMNPIGFENISRNITFSREDLNRSFPGNPNGSLGERIGHLIFNRIIETKPDLLLDLHADWRHSVPYVLLDRKPEEIGTEVYEKTKAFCSRTGFYIIEDIIEIRSSLTHNLLLRNIPAVTFELGESYVVNEKIIEYGVRSILNILADLEMIVPLPQEFSFPLHKQYLKGQILGYTDRPLCTKSGIVRFLAKPGDMIRKGQPVAKIFNAFGKLQESIVAAQPAILLGNADSSVAFPGMSVVAFGII